MLLPAPTRSRELVHVPRRATVVPLPNRELTSLTAAAVRVTRARSGQYRRLIQPWQQRALAYYDSVGECWNSAQFYSRSLKQVRIFIAERDDSGELKETENEAIAGEINRIQDPGGGGYSRLFDAYGRLMFLTGEGYFLVTNPDGEDESWEFVSSDELRLTGEGDYTRFAAPSLPAEMLRDVPDSAYQPIGDEALVFRAWRPHPRYSALADGPVRAVLDLLEELVLLTLTVRARAKSRLASNGILAIPEELSTAPLEAVGDEDPELDPVLADLIEQIVMPIENPGTAAAVSPAMIRGPGEWLDKIKWIQISNPLETYPEEGLRTEAVRRYAIGIEMPAQLLTAEDMNHWGVWLVDEQAARQYIFPMCQMLVDDLTSVWLRPMLRDDGVADWDKYVIAYDASAVVAHPDRTKDARELHDRLVISDETLRNASDFNDSDAPDEEEYMRRVGLKLKDVPTALGEPYEVTPTPEISPDEEQTEQEGAPQSGAEVDAGAPEGIESDAGDIVASVSAETMAFRSRVEGACANAVLRARERAGAQLRSALQGAPDDSFATTRVPKDGLRDIPNDQLAAALGPEWVRAYSARRETDLVGKANQSTHRMLTLWGVTDGDADKLIDLVEKHAAKGLYSPAPRDVPKPIRTVIAGLKP